PPGVRTWPLVLRGPAGPALVSLARQPGDLLVIGAGRRTALTRLVCCPVARHCLAHAHRPVLAVPPPDLAPPTRHALRALPPPPPPPPATPSCPARLPATHATPPAPRAPGYPAWSNPMAGPGANHAPRQRRQLPPNRLICIHRPSGRSGPQPRRTGSSGVMQTVRPAARWSTIPAARGAFSLIFPIT